MADAKSAPRVDDELAANMAHAAAGAAATHPQVPVSPVSPTVADQSRLYSEAVRQTLPLADPGTAAVEQLADAVRAGTALSRGLSPETAERYVTTPRSLESFLSGANPTGKLAEVVVASDYRELHAGRDPGIVNPPERVAPNVRDIRLAPDPSSRKDLLFGFEGSDGRIIWKYNGQVKTGGAQYVADSLVEMAETSGYGKVAYVDARYVKADGSPRVGRRAFSEAQARRLQDAGVRLRGVRGLHKRMRQLQESLEAATLDGLAPDARAQLQQLRDDIAAAYEWRGVAGRVIGGAAVAAASAAVASLVVQLATDGKLDLHVVGQTAGVGAVFGAAAAAADAGVYHFASGVLELTPEIAKEVAKDSVAAMFCVLAVGTDVLAELRAARAGPGSVSNVVGGIASKSALDLLPFVLAPLGLAGIPLLVGAQVGGRWLIGKAREVDRVLERAIAEDLSKADELQARTAAFSVQVRDLAADCDETDGLFREAMGLEGPRTRSLYVIKD